MSKGELFVLSAPSGTGKTTIIQTMMSRELAGFDRLVFSVSHTTRKARRGEVDGRDYHFVDRHTFEEMIAEDRFLEWAEVHNQYKGTTLEEVVPRLEDGIDVLVDIDVQGAEQVLREWPDAVSIFIMPPSFEDLGKRLRGRDLDESDEIRRRLAVSVSEIRRYDLYQYVIINADLERASRALAAIILEKRHRLDRMNEAIESVIARFPAVSEDDTGRVETSEEE